MKTRLPVLLAVAATMAIGSAAADDRGVVVSIKPIHSLVAGVMKGVGTPTLIVDGAASPHNYSLKPSQARALQNAKAIFWIGHELEAFLEKPVATLGAGARVVELMDADGLTELAVREGGTFEEHDHGEHDTHDKDHAHDHKHEAEHEHHGSDPHLWLDPANARIFIHEIDIALAEVDPKNKAVYDANAKAMTADLDALTAELTAAMKPVQGKPFVVFHDGYRYFENRFGLNTVGSITVSPEVIPGAERIEEIHAKIKSLQAVCVFTEPQFEPKLISVVTEGTGAKVGTLDPLGAALPPGPGLYATLLRNMAASLRNCLARE